MGHVDIPADGGWHPVPGTPTAAIAASPDTVRISFVDDTADVEARAIPTTEAPDGPGDYIATVVAGAAMWHVIGRPATDPAQSPETAAAPDGQGQPE